MKIEIIESEAPSLDKFIRRVPDEKTNQLIDRKDQKIIAFDRDKGMASGTQVSFWDNLARGLGLAQTPECYIVDAYSAMSVESRQKLKVTSQKYGILEVHFAYIAGASSGKEAKLVERLVRRGEPAKTLQQILIDWSNESVASFGEGIYTNFQKFQEETVSALQNKADGIGIKLKVSISHGTTLPRPTERLSFSVEDVRLQPKGYSDFIHLSFDVTLTSGSSTGFYFSDETQLKNELKNLLAIWIQEFVQSGISFNEIVENLHEQFREKTILYWNERLNSSNKGGKVIELRFRFADAMPESFRFEQMVIPVILKEDTIDLVNNVILTIEDPQRFKNSRVTDIETWLRDKLRQTTQIVLTGITFAELASRIDEFQRIIKSDLDKEARLIGYRVTYILTSSPVGKVRKNFSFEFDDDDQDYETDSNDLVKLNVIVNGRIKDYNHDNLRRIMTKDMVDPTQEMKKEARKEVRKFILRCRPDQYYLDFDTVVGPPLEGLLRSMLIKQFNVEQDVDIVLQWQGSALITRLRRLMQGFIFVDVEDRGGSLKFQIKFNVEGVHKQQWGRFSALGFENREEEVVALRQEVKAAVENRMRKEFHSMKLPNSTRLTEFVHAFATEAMVVVSQNTGLIIRINNVEQLNNIYLDSLIEFSENEGMKQLEEMSEEIKKLDEQIKKLEQTNWMPQKVAELKAKRAELQKKLTGSGYGDNLLNASSDEELAKKWLGEGKGKDTPESED